MNLLFLVTLFPLLGAVLLACFRRMPVNLAATIGVGSMALAALTTAWLGLAFFAADQTPYVQHLWNWVAVGDFRLGFDYRLDGLSLTMLGVITGVGFLIHLFASWYMREDLKDQTGYLYTRFFCYMNLFVFSMLVLVLGDNLMLMFLGWEGVGLCSYLLIGYYYRGEANAWAAFKAFIITRVGDVFLAIGMFLIWVQFGTLDIQTILAEAPSVLAEGALLTEVTALMLLGGAVGKSAQLPLQTWLADAMAGPTPVSALIHAATMVTAGVYLIARTHVLFELAPFTLELVGVIGMVTLLVAGFSALAQTDIKRVLAYSTMSQIGYMFLALGVQAYDAAIFHLMIHAFFKALLFLASGSVIIACHHEQNIFKMGGLAKQIPLAYASFLVGGAALAALPIVTAGFYSKDEILWLSFASGHTVLWLGALFGAFMTSVYTFRMIFVVFHGKANLHAHAPQGIAHHLPLVVLMVLSTFVGTLITPPLAGVLPELEIDAGHATQIAVEVLAAVVAIVGVGIAAGLFLGRRRLMTSLVESEQGGRVWRFLHGAFGFDTLYDRLFVKPYLLIARLHRVDWINALINLFPGLAKLANYGLSASQNGQMRGYAATFVLGATIVVAALVLG
ncbi:NADH-quinone oxidoreductase subunit L [Halotalea alkalilenta]|uniref:NADH-quinone oxidoreductase subunit L n=1 Tax=Halotalea alkalilenta TaxID=376489 RepID=A0A172YBZ5_9GAMM|nr:NADH-quinone oxidoreductase subunit L [Halotalea alkalilenta]ANF56738.1 NADH-quinone oxidoreductase subunit L [Halotalea alkalilenta]